MDDTQDWTVHKINSVIGAHPEMGGRTLRDAMTEEQKLGGTWKDFRFDHIERILRADGEKSNIDPLGELSPDTPLRSKVTVKMPITNGYRVMVEAGPDKYQSAVIFKGILDQKNIRPTIGTQLEVRLGNFERGPRVVKIYDVLANGVSGSIAFVKSGEYAFLKRDDGGENVFILGRLLTRIQNLEVGLRLVVRVRSSERSDEAYWVDALPAEATHTQQAVEL